MIYASRARDDPFLFSICSLDALGAVMPVAAGGSSTAYPLANLALFVPFSVPMSCKVLEGWAMCGVTAAGNFDIGVYDTGGTRLTSSGSTVKGSSVPVNTTTMTDLVLAPNVTYYLAMSADGVNNYTSSVYFSGVYEACGVLEVQTAFVLPAGPVTYVRTTRSALPYYGLNLQATGF